MPDDGRTPADHKRAKLFMHGGSQAVRLPKEFRFDGVDVEIWRDGDTVHLRAAGHDVEQMFREIDARRGDEVMPYPVQAILEDRDYGFDS